ncbi:hypothetical protein GCM10022255_113420 [Dactylosporangium darangshiense]|uniref:Uncharacterized protein n=1 Tax=Dactylosporangium darangshiense TaxID=579108 RepID=A0ABP8DWA4_9ACTN
MVRAQPALTNTAGPRPTELGRRLRTEPLLEVVAVARPSRPLDGRSAYLPGHHWPCAANPGAARRAASAPSAGTVNPITRKQCPGDQYQQVKCDYLAVTSLDWTGQGRRRREPALNAFEMPSKEAFRRPQVVPNRTSYTVVDTPRYVVISAWMGRRARCCHDMTQLVQESAVAVCVVGFGFVC